MNEKKTILIAGYYGFGNVGDEAILSAVLADLRRKRQNLQFIVLSGNPSETITRYHVQSVHWKDVDGLLNAAKESDLIILGGGGLFQDYWGVPKNTALTPSHWGISYYSAIGMLAVLYQKPFMIYSVGVGPILSEEGKRLTHWTFDLANIGSVRDLESRDLLISLGIQKEKVEVIPDPALNLSLDSRSAAQILQTRGIDPKTRPLLGVCIRNWFEGDEAEKWKKELAATLDQFLETCNAQVIFIPFQMRDHALENDHSVALNIVSMMKNQDLVYVLSESFPPAIVGGLISHCHLIVGMRLHSLIFAANAGIPAVALVYDPKVYNFMRSLDLSEYAVGIQSMTREQLSGTLETAWAQQKQLQQILLKRMTKLKSLTKKALVMALNLLDKKSKMPYSSEVVHALAIQQTRSLAEKEQKVQTLSSLLTAKKQEVQLLQSQLGAQQHEIDLLQSQLEARWHELNEILYSKSWKLVQALRRLRISLLPPGSRREQFAKMLYRYSRELFYILSKAVTLIHQSTRRHGLPLAILRGFRILGIRIYHANKKIFHRNKYDRELKQLDAVISQHMGFFDLFHVPMGWKTALFQRFQHISLQTAKLGGLALYGGHPIVDREITVYQKAANNLYVFDATNRQVVARIFQALEKKQQPRILRVQSIDLVTTEEDVNHFIRNGFTVVYEYIDEINPAITGVVPDLVYHRHTAILKDERVIVVATSDQLFEDVQRYRSENFLLSTNGVDLDHWRITKGEPPTDLRPALNGNLIVGYHGALAKWMDYELLRIIADEGSYELVLIGHEHDGTFAESGLKDHPRVHFLGSKTYFELNTYAIHYDIAILPFRKMDLTQSVSPVKIFEYMAARKPIVATDLRECRKYQSCLVASTSIEFMEQLKRAAELRNDLDYLRVLDKEASENSWEGKTTELLRLAGVKI